jgi:Fe-S oxidoreductase
LIGDTDRALKIAKPILEEAQRLKVKKIVVSECGHAYRVMKKYFELWFGEHPFEVELIAETIAGYIKNGRLKLDKSKNPEKFTHHDSCQHGRNGGVFDDPRIILNAVTDDYVDMVPSRELNWCCGGGGGVVAVPEFENTRRNGGNVKIKQIKDTEAQVVTVTCDNCMLTLQDLNEYSKIGVRIEGITATVARSLVW